MRLSDVILKGTRADQPSFLLLPVGALYCVSDEGDIIEMNTGTAWVSYSPAVSAAITSLTGDVTAVGPGAAAATIANAAVSLAKMADLAQARVIGRASGAGTGVPTALTPDQLSTILDAAADPFVRSSILAAALGLDFLTFSDESGSLPNSRNLIAGTNITFDDTVANQRTINASGGGAGDWDTTVVKASNDDITNSSTLTGDSELIIAVTSGNKYMFEALIVLQGNDASVNYKWNVSHPGAANLNSVFGFYDYITNGGSPTHITAQGTTAVWPTAAGVQFGVLAINVDMYMHCLFFLTPNANGNVVWQQANANPAVGRTSSTRIGSTLRMRQLNA